MTTQTETPEIKEGYVIEYYHVRWAPYKKDGARQMRKKGRWQCSNGYGGYENCDTPERIYPCPIDYDSAAKLKAERDAALARVSALEAALKMMVAEKVDYMDINNLGDPETQHTIKYARAALTKDQSNG